MTREHEPDPAALDELSRAFATDRVDAFEGVRVIPRGEPARQSPHPVEPAGPVDEPTAAAAVDGPFTEPVQELADDPEPTAPTPTEPAEPFAPRATIAIGGGDDELPDAVYVQGNLDGGGRRGGVVIIEDDDTGDAVKADSERDLRRGIEPRLRERRIAVKRAQGRKRLMWAGLAVAVVVAVVTVLAVLGSDLFAVQAEQVTVVGNVYTDPERLQAVVDDLVGTPTLRADTGRFEGAIEEIPWVESAKVTVRFPHAASIEIRERQAMATYQGPDRRFRVIDRQGRVLDVLDMYPLAYLLIDGPDPVDREPGQFAPRGYAAAAELAKTMPANVRTRVDHVEVAADGTYLDLVFTDGTQVVFGEARDLLTKLVRLETVLDRIALAEAGEPSDGGGALPTLPGVIDVSTSETTS